MPMAFIPAMQLPVIVFVSMTFMDSMLFMSSQVFTDFIAVFMMFTASLEPFVVVMTVFLVSEFIALVEALSFVTFMVSMVAIVLMVFMVIPMMFVAYKESKAIIMSMTI
jgi:hypothetical protein